MSWARKKLSEICAIRPPKSEARKLISENDLVSFIGMEHLGINQKFTAPRVEKKLSDAASSYTYFAENDVLLAKITPCFENGKLGIAKNLTNKIGFGSSEFIVFRTLEEISNEWLYYFLSREQFLHEGANNMSGAVGHKRVNKDFIENYEIPLPPLTTQQKIVSKLDAIFKEIEKATAATEINTKNSKNLFQSYLTKIFKEAGEDWVDMTLQDITTKIGSGSTPTGGNAAYKKSGISLIRSMNVYDAGFQYQNLAFIDDTQANALAGVTIQEDDILLNITGASVARCCIAPNDVLPARVNQHVSILRAKKDLIDPRLLHFILISPFHKRKLLSTGESGGTTREAITKAQLQTYTISFPKSIPKQQALIKKIEVIQALSNKLEKASELKAIQLQLLKQSTLEKAFNGELVKD